MRASIQDTVDMDSGPLASLGPGMTSVSTPLQGDYQNAAVPLKTLKAQVLHLPDHRDAFYGGKWHKTKAGRTTDAINPGIGARKNNHSLNVSYVDG